MNIEVVKQKCHEMGRYDMSYLDVIELVKEARKGGVDSFFNLATLSYTYGFIRGGNAERSKQKRQKRIKDGGK